MPAQTPQAKLTPIREIKPAKRNARRHTEPNLAAIRSSIEQFGQREALVVRNGEVVGGNARLGIMRDLGIKEVLTISADDLSEKEAMKLAIALNRSGELAEWDAVELMAQMDLIGGELPGFSKADLEEMRREAVGQVEIAEDVVPEPPKKATTKPGDVWQLGRHRVVCGDVADRAALLFGDKKFSLLVTDPPYGVSYASKNEFLNSIDKGNRIQDEIENDQHKPEEMHALWEKWFAAIRPHAQPGASYYVTGPQGGDLLLLLEALRAAGFPLRHMLVWAKNNHVLGRCDYHYKHEPILYGWVDGTHRFHGGRGETSLWEIDRPMVSDLHPTMKPVELFAKAVNNSSMPGEIVADPFLGPGTTLIAAEQLDRICYGSEIEPRYMDVVIQRWENLTGGKARRIAGNGPTKRTKPPHEAPAQNA